MKRITKQEAIESFGKESVQVAMSQELSQQAGLCTLHSRTPNTLERSSMQVCPSQWTVAS